MSTVRYALYFSPAPQTALARFGWWWLGRREDDGVLLPLPELPGLTPERQATIVAEARNYGFHATLKPPFRLREGRTAAELTAAVADFVADRRAIMAAPPVLTELDGFLALELPTPDPAVAELAADCVTVFDEFRAPTGAVELERRRRAGLTAMQDQYLVTWGYPYVLSEFRFHMTLTRRLDPAERRQVAAVLRPLLISPCGHPLAMDALSLCRQDDTGSPFVLIQRFALA